MLATLKSGAFLTPQLRVAAAIKYECAANIPENNFIWTKVYLQTNNAGVMPMRNNFNIIPSISPSILMITTARNYSSEEKPEPGRPPIQQSSGPATPALPDREQIEKYVFRIIAFIWDVSHWLITWTQKNFNKYIVKNQTIQNYYKQFLDKMEKSKKD